MRRLYAEGIEKIHYDWNRFICVGDRLKYGGKDGYSSKLGVDVSYYQGILTEILLINLHKGLGDNS